MVFGLFTQAKPPPLTAFCTQLSQLSPTNLLEFTGRMITNTSTKVDNRAVVLSILIMAAAGHFVEDLRSNKEQMYKDLRQFLSDTNLDVITAETIVWVTFLMGRLWKADQEREITRCSSVSAISRLPRQDG